jgi:hypothetical protein
VPSAPFGRYRAGCVAGRACVLGHLVVPLPPLLAASPHAQGPPGVGSPGVSLALQMAAETASAVVISLGLQESADVLGAEPCQLVVVVVRLAVLDPMHEHVRVGPPVRGARPPFLAVGSDEADHDRDAAHRPLRDVRRLLDVEYRPSHPPSVEQMFA